jgi:hypothetical protein
MDDFLPAEEGHDFEFRDKYDDKTGDERACCRQTVVPAIGE